MPTEPLLEVRRIYEADVNGYRVLVDRLWPRGVTKRAAALDEWLRDVAPSAELRRWYSHDVTRFDEFTHRYRAELRGPDASPAVAHLASIAISQPLVLLTATRDIPHSGAHVLCTHLTDLITGRSDTAA